MKSFPHYLQLDSMDCGPTCLRMIARHYGKMYSLQTLRERSFITREGVSMLGISDAAESIGFRTIGVRLSFEQLAQEATLPCVLHWNQRHFVVCYRIKKRGRGGYDVYIADPASKNIVYQKDEFLRCWLSKKEYGEERGIALLLEPGPEFGNIEDEKTSTKRDLLFFVRYLTPYKRQFVQLAIGMLVGSGLQMIFLSLRNRWWMWVSGTAISDLSRSS